MNFDKYFSGKKYYEPSIMIDILEDIVGKDYSFIKSDIVKGNVFVTDRDIIDFLEQQFFECDIDALKRINNSDLKNLNSDKLFGEKQLEYLKKYSDCFDDYLVLRKYTFEPYSLLYFKRYISILKEKLLLLLDNYFLIGCGCPNGDFLDELDIVLLNNGMISKEDIIRLIKPILYNINEFNNMLNEANDLSTYLNFKMSRFLLYRNGLSDKDIYPNSSLQVDNVLSDEDGYVELSFNQRKKYVKKI